MNVVEPILFQARLLPEAPALCAPGRDLVTYGQLALQMRNVGHRALSFGLKAGDVAVVSIDDPLVHVATVFGLTQVGIIPVLAGRRRPPPGLKIDAVITSGNYPFATTARHFTLDFTWLMGSGAIAETIPRGADASDKICLVSLTSGTTGSPKAIALTHQMVAVRSARYDYLCGPRCSTISRLYISIGLNASFAYYRLVGLLMRGGTAFFRGDNIENTLRSFEAFRVQSMISTPATLAQLLQHCDQYPGIEVQFDSIVSSAGKSTAALIERVRPRLCSQLFLSYGATETGLSATAPAHRIVHIPGAVGYVMPGIEIEIVDAEGSPLPAGEEGIVRIASEFAVDHYAGDPDESAKVFRDGWFYPGDIGSLTSDNLLIISGRQNNVLNVGGGKIAAERLEAALVSFNGISEAAVFVEANELGVEEVWAAIICSDAINIEALRAHLRRRMPPAFVPAHVVTVDALPLNEACKLDRELVKRRVRGDASVRTP
jgi:acyl-coenzyme A synthetase/AMP-(fatty) acid ligase